MESEAIALQRGRGENEVFWKRKPPIEYSDQALRELSQMFFQDSEEPTFGVEQLSADGLSYSIDSLAEINKYLDRVRVDPRIQSVWNQVVLRCGAYVGEVIRQNSATQEYHWLDFKNATKIDQQTFEALGYTIGTAAVLYKAPSSFCFPLAKVEKYLLNGSEDDVQFFAQVVLAQEDDSSQ